MDPIRSVDLRRIRHFVALAERLNFTRAAQDLHIVQPALTVSIRKLEQELGTQLFIREPRGVSLTHSGQAALQEAYRILFHAEQFVDLVHNTERGVGGILRVGFVGSTSFGLLQKLVPRFRTEHPRVELELREATSSRILQMIEQEELNLGLVRTPLLQHSNVSLLELDRDCFVVALPVDNPWAHKPRLRLSELADEHFVMYSAADAAGLHASAMAACQRAGFMPSVKQEAVQIQTVLALVESGLGVALIPSVMRKYQSTRIQYRSIPELTRSQPIGWALAFDQETETMAGRHFRGMVSTQRT
ncbi:LysR family transcriptional regulator [Allopusillimonas soli]|uniref:LysR family transcriptional regulator n=1 Tax=Allopusillimonas soli TaxID=659016 RepID=A0A853FAQ8_9BURK|nr:LysR substrate-binding domain-containing protein [Allopusillimonas soli]NYT36010.1 LysR family transcriptional regulator [Allopusillimonas soli]TEA76354.1 LysR family transcriptional regulator [Allopusillimonas soli]